MRCIFSNLPPLSLIFYNDLISLLHLACEISLTQRYIFFLEKKWNYFKLSDAFCFLGIEAENWNVKEFRGPISQLGNEDGFSLYGPFAWTVSSSPYVSMWLVKGYFRRETIKFLLHKFFEYVFPKENQNGTQIRQIFL